MFKDTHVEDSQRREETSLITFQLNTEKLSREKRRGFEEDMGVGGWCCSAGDVNHPAVCCVRTS